ncbi:MAG: MBL fold metallo-hydrolase [Burkholderiaceae bacterium]
MSVASDCLALLGTKGGAAIRPGSAMPTATLLRLGGRNIVVDCGLGVTRGLVDQGLALRDLSRIFITHLHADHYLELGPLLHTAWLAGLQTPIDVHGPAGLGRYWAGWLQAMAAEIDSRERDEGRPALAELVRIHVVDDGTVPFADGLEVRAMRNRHPPLTDSFAYSFAAGGRRICFSGNTAYAPELAELFRGTDVLVHEAMLSSSLEALAHRIGNARDGLMRHWLNGHTRAADAARLAQASDVGMLVFHHLIPADDPAVNEHHWLAEVRPNWSGPFVLGRDGLVIGLCDGPPAASGPLVVNAGRPR